MKKNHERAADQAQISASIPKSLKDQIQHAAEQANISASKWITQKLEQAITGNASTSDLPEPTQKALAKLSMDTHIPASTLHDIAIKAVVDYTTANDGRLILPLVFINPTSHNQPGLPAISNANAGNPNSHQAAGN